MKTSANLQPTGFAAESVWLVSACLLVCAAVLAGLFLLPAGEPTATNAAHRDSGEAGAQPLPMRKAAVFSKQVAAVGKLKQSLKNKGAKPASAPDATTDIPSETRFVEVPAKERVPFAVSLEHLSQYFDVQFQCLEPFREVDPDPEIKIDQYEVDPGRVCILP